MAEEIAGNFMDLVGYASLETVQDRISERKEHADKINHGLMVLKYEKSTSNSHMHMPSYGVQVTVRTKLDKHMDKPSKHIKKQQLTHPFEYCILL